MVLVKHARDPCDEGASHLRLFFKEPRAVEWCVETHCFAGFLEREAFLGWFDLRRTPLESEKVQQGFHERDDIGNFLLTNVPVDNVI